MLVDFTCAKQVDVWLLNPLARSCHGTCYALRWVGKEGTCVARVACDRIYKLYNVQKEQPSSLESDASNPLFQFSLWAMSSLCRMNMSERYSSSIWSDAYFDGWIVRITHSILHIFSYLLRQKIYCMHFCFLLFELVQCRQPWKTAMALRHQEPLPSRRKPQSANQRTKCFWFWVFSLVDMG